MSKVDEDIGDEDIGDAIEEMAKEGRRMSTHILEYYRKFSGEKLEEAHRAMMRLNKEKNGGPYYGAIIMLAYKNRRKEEEG